MTCVWKGSHWLAIILLKFKKIKKKGTRISEGKEGNEERAE